MRISQCKIVNASDFSNEYTFALFICCMADREEKNFLCQQFLKIDRIDIVIFFDWLLQPIMLPTKHVDLSKVPWDDWLDHLTLWSTAITLRSENTT